MATALDPAARRDLGGLQKDLAESVARHLVAAGSLVDEDPQAALEHARYARRRASRIAVVREAAGIAAYHAGEWSEALAELRAARRMGGGTGHLPVMADVERAMGRPERAIELARGPEARELGRSAQVELAIVVAGARRDLGELDAAVVGLQIPELEAARRDPWSARLFYAYADNLLAAGRESDALQWFVHALDADPDGHTDADARIAELTGEPLVDDGIEFGLDEELDADADGAEDRDDDSDDEDGVDDLDSLGSDDRVIDDVDSEGPGVNELEPDGQDEAAIEIVVSVESADGTVADPVTAADSTTTGIVAPAAVEDAVGDAAVAEAAADDDAAAAVADIAVDIAVDTALAAAAVADLDTDTDTVDTAAVDAALADAAVAETVDAAVPDTAGHVAETTDSVNADNDTATTDTAAAPGAATVTATADTAAAVPAGGTAATAEANSTPTANADDTAVVPGAVGAEGSADDADAEASPEPDWTELAELPTTVRGGAAGR